MAFTKSADGIAKKGKTTAKVFPNSGPSKGTQMGGNKKSGVSSESMKTMGRNMARVNNQRGG
jgi:hypothetical protein